MAPMGKTLDRYLLREVLSPFLVGLVVYTFTLLINNVLLLSQALISKEASAATVLLILLYFLPDLLSFTVPMATLMGVLAGLSRMSTDSEIVALRTMGVSNSRLLRPVMVFATLAWLFSSWLIMYVAPETNYRLNRLFTEVVFSQTVSNIRPGVFYREIPYYALFFQDADPQTRHWRNVFLYSMRAPEKDSLILAQEGAYVHDRAGGEGTIVLWNGVMHEFKKKEPRKYTLTGFSAMKEKVPGMAPVQQGRRSTQLVFPELKRRYREAQDDPLLAMEYHKKFALPFACLALGFLALPLGISTRRGGKTSGFIVSLGIIFLYYVLITTARNLILKEVISPMTGMWLPNLFLMVAGGYFFVRAGKEKEIHWDGFAAWLERFRRPRHPRRVLFSLRLPAPRFSLLPVLDRYVLRKMALVFFLVFSSLWMIFCIVTVVELINNVIENKVPFVRIFDYLWYNTPEMIGFILPVSVLTTVLLSLFLMNRQNEVVAVQLSGVSLLRLARPALVLGVVASLCYLGVQETILPGARKKAVTVLNEINNRKVAEPGTVLRNWVIGRDSRTIYFYSYFERETQSFTSWNTVELGEGGELRRRLYADRAVLREGQLDLTDGYERTFVDQAPVSFVPFTTRTVPFAERRDSFFQKEEYPDDMNARQLRHFVQYLRRHHRDTRNAEAQLYGKYAFPFGSLVMVLIAIPFAFLLGRQGALSGIGVAVAISMVYWGTIGVFKALGGTGLLPPLAAAFLPLLIFGALGTWLFSKIRT